jgi:hypothetical protein
MYLYGLASDYRKPCSHALAFIAKLSREVQMDDFAHEYFCVERLRKAYTGSFIPMTSKDLCLHVDLGYKTIRLNQEGNL